MTVGAPLAGRRVLVTRPAGEAASLAEAIRTAGGEPLLLPAIEIGPPDEPARVDALLGRLRDFDLAIFISPTAVGAAFARLEARGGWPVPDASGRPRAACVGPGTARVLAARGVADVLVPAGSHDSEGLLAHAALANVAGWQILIVRGVGGRETLAAELERRGATVTYAECYRRGPPTWDAARLAGPLAAGAVDAVVLLSAEAAANLVAHLPAPASRAALLALPAVVPHERVAEALRAMGFGRVHAAPGGESGIVEALAAGR